MSLSIMLINPEPVEVDVKIPIREKGRTIEITVAEWKKRHPFKPLPITRTTYETEIAWQGNITHNLSKMAAACGLYVALWNPNSLGYILANDVVPQLEIGLRELMLHPLTYKMHTPQNGLGDYDGLVAFVEEYLEACVNYPDARIEVWT